MNFNKSISISTRNGKSIVTIDGKSYAVDGGNISIKNNQIYVDGKPLTNSEVKGIEDIKVVNITIEGDCNGNIVTAGSVTVNGKCNGNIDCSGHCDVVGDVKGDIDCGGYAMVNGSCFGNIDAGGSVICR